MEYYIKEFTSYLVAEKNASPHTIESYLNDISQFKEFLKKSGHAGEFFDFKNRWNLGYENLDKDGYFIGRKFKKN